MRKMIAAAAVLAVTSLHAEELKFGDANYFLKTSQFNVTADVNQVYSAYQPKGGDEFYKRGYLIETRYGFGVTDQFNVFLGVDYAFDYQTHNKTVSSDGDYNEDGFASPAVGANFRLLNQNSSAFNLDFGAVARIGVQDAERGDSVGQDKNDGNFANAQDSLDVNARIGKKWNEANEWQFTIGAVYFADGEYDSKLTTGTLKVDSDSKVDMYARALYQYRPVNEFMMTLTAQLTRVGELDEKTSGVTTTYDSHMDMKFAFGAKYLITESIIGKFNVGTSNNQDIDVKTATGNTEIRNRINTNYGIGADFLF